MKRLISALNVVVILSLTGCGWLGLRDRSDDYLLAEETAVTVVPQGHGQNGARADLSNPDKFP